MRYLRELLLWPLWATLVVALAAPYVGSGTLAAFVAQTANPHNVFQAGTLRLTTSRAGQALFTVEAIAPTSSNVATSGATVQMGPPAGGLAPGTKLANSLTLINSGTLPAGELRLFVPDGGIENTNDAAAGCGPSNRENTATPDCGRQRLSDALELLVYYPVDAEGSHHVCVYGGNDATIGRVVDTTTSGLETACGFGRLTAGLGLAASGTVDVATTTARSRLRTGVLVPHAVSTDTVQAQWPAGQSRTVQLVVRLPEAATNAVQGAKATVTLLWKTVAQAVATGATQAGGSEGGAPLGVGGSAALVFAPDPPQSVSAIAGDGEATVMWATSAFDGGRPITGYTVTAVEDATKTVAVGAGTQSARLTGLANDTSYTFAVRATNVLGTGAAGVSAPVTPASAWLVTTSETWTGTRSFTNLTIKPGGNVGHNPWDTTLTITVSGTLRIEAGGSIDVSGGGCWGAANAYQPGMWWNGSSCTDTGGSPESVGGSYGGLGGGTGPNATYGRAANPMEVGSGGGSGCCWPWAGGTGGGLVRLTAGALHLDGALRANGTAGGVYGGAGGSGGGIYVNVGTLSGTGVIEANGGRGRGGGGGGRIAALADVSTFSGAMSACPGEGEGTKGGGAGTVFTSTRAGASPRLVVDGNRGTLVGAATPVDVLPSGTDLVVRNGARFVNAAVRPTFGSLTVSGNSYAGFPEGTTFGDVTVSGTATVEVAATSAAPLSANSIDLRSGARLTHYTAQFSVSPPSPLGLFVQAAGAVTVDATSAIDVSGKGCWGGGSIDQPGRWWNGSGCTDTGGSPGSVGGSYGGMGGGTGPNATYGTAANPMEVGSGGGHGWNYPGTGGTGGGLVRLTAGALHLDGVLRANGTDGGGSGAGGGSGGGIYVNAGTLSGTGTIEANGGRGLGGGGGGRIAIIAPNRGGFSGSVSVGGGPGQPSGQNGTVHSSS